MPGTAESTLSDAKEHEKTLQSEHFQIQPATDCCPPTPRWDCGAQVSYSSSQVMETCRERASEARETLRPPVKGGDGERELKLNRVSHWAQAEGRTRSGRQRPERHWRGETHKKHLWLSPWEEKELVRVPKLQEDPRQNAGGGGLNTIPSINTSHPIPDEKELVVTTQSKCSGKLYMAPL